MKNCYLAIFSAILMISATSLALGEEPTAGGACTYDTFKGTCKVAHVSSSGQIGFYFTPYGEMNLSNVTWVNKSSLTGQEYFYTFDASGASISVGSAFACTVSIEKQGTCTPIIWRRAFEQSCLAEGQGGSLSNPGTCCAELTRVQTAYPSGDLCSATNNGGFVCTRCGNGICGTGENRCNCPNDCTIIKEQVKCLFRGSTITQTCSSENARCSGITECVASVSGTRGQKIIWKSSCGGYASTTIDGQDEYAGFDCTTTSCVKEGQTIDTSGTRKCCEGLTPVSGCEGSAKGCSADSWVCKRIETKCAAEGQFTSGPVSSGAYSCCPGLEGFFPWPETSSGGNLCYNLTKGKPECKAAGSKSEGWYYPNGVVLKYMVCSYATCAKENELFTDSGRQCCQGLTKISTWVNCSKEENCITKPGYTCKQPETKCASEGQTVWPTGTGHTPNECCSGLTRIAYCTDTACANTVSGICTYCGNGFCGTGESQLNCPKDCPSSIKCKPGNNSCCTNNGCVSITATCNEGYAYSFGGCDNQCSPKWSCTPIPQTKKIGYGCNSCIDGTLCGQSNAEGTPCICVDATGDGINTFCQLRSISTTEVKSSYSLDEFISGLLKRLGIVN